MPPNYPRRTSGLNSSQAATTRRRFLQVSAAAASGVVLSNCARNLSNANNNANSESSPTAGSASSSGDSKTLYVYTWANYTDDALLKSFQEKTGINAIVDIFDSNETMLAKMQAGGGNAYSIIYPSDYMVTQMAGLGLLTALDKSRIKGLTNLRTKWKDPTYDPNNEHSIPTTWGTTGLIYDPKRLGTKIEGWSYVWDHVNALNRKVTLINDVREVMGATLKFLGYSFNDTDPTQIQKAYDKLVNLKPAIASFMTNGWEDQIATGDLSVSMAYSSDALALIEENPELSYVIPKTGASLWTDTMVIPKSAPNVNAAYEWINFILEPENSAQLVQRLKFATPNQAAYELLPAELKNNQKLYPPEAILEKCEGVAPLPQKTTDLYDRYWTQLTST